jgi:DinB superfamily
MEAAYGRLRGRLEGLTERELLWEPVPGAWTIYPEASGRWTYHYAIPEPEPAPLTTIGWHLNHVSTCKLMYHEWAFGPARMTWPEVPVAHTVDGLLAQLEDGQALLRDDLTGLAEDRLDEPVLTNWGETWPAWRIFWTMADHDAQHGGVIGQLRDLYRSRSSLTGSDERERDSRAAAAGPRAGHGGPPDGHQLLPGRGRGDP